MIERPIVGFVAIGEALLTTPRQVLAWATRKVDPLRLVTYQGMPRILPSALKSWRDRHMGAEGLRRVRGWHLIAERVEVSRMAAIRVSEREQDPLPVTHPASGMVWAFETALDDWKRAQEVPYWAHRAIRAQKGKR